MMKESEFTVSEDTAKWVRLIKALHEVWNTTSELTDNEEIFMRDYYPHFVEIETKLANDVGQSVLNTIGWTDTPPNVI